eukprot:TRINITY_DN409_c1_g1_i1.p2 TRINITY_DN409_c1_g1~~TRINITY_DN409_c1_g1_i1.p2  ORF type:complete len:103 (+),score=29.70 TRINITY_DN409_c1_g1_i1:50-358(+)
MSQRANEGSSSSAPFIQLTSLEFSEVKDRNLEQQQQQQQLQQQLQQSQQQPQPPTQPKPKKAKDRLFKQEQKNLCWEKAGIVPGRNPNRWRYDIAEILSPSN